MLKKSEHVSKTRVILTTEKLRGRKALGSRGQSTVFFLTRNVANILVPKTWYFYEARPCE